MYFNEWKEGVLLRKSMVLTKKMKCIIEYIIVNSDIKYILINEIDSWCHYLQFLYKLFYICIIINKKNEFYYEKKHQKVGNGWD